MYPFYFFLFISKLFHSPGVVCPGVPLPYCIHFSNISSALSSSLLLYSSSPYDSISKSAIPFLRQCIGLENKMIGSECDAYHILAIFICYQRIYIECYHFLAFFANGADRQVHQDSSIYIICIVDAYGGKQDRHTAGSSQSFG